VQQGSKTAIDGDVNVVPVDYSNKESIKDALTGIDVVISTVPPTALGVQLGIAEAAKEAGVKLFVPSEFGGVTEGATEGVKASKARVQDQLKAVGIPYTLFYTGAYADFIWVPYAPDFLAFTLLLTVKQALQPRPHKWESNRRWRWQQADVVHSQA
jgi:uncharacterized protein YbjT (DUF2867 family)